MARTAILVLMDMVQKDRHALSCFLHREEADSYLAFSQISLGLGRFIKGLLTTRTDTAQ